MKLSQEDDAQADISRPAEGWTNVLKQVSQKSHEYKEKKSCLFVFRYGAPVCGFCQEGEHFTFLNCVVYFVR